MNKIILNIDNWYKYWEANSTFLFENQFLPPTPILLDKEKGTYLMMFAYPCCCRYDIGEASKTLEPYPVLYNLDRPI